MGGDVTGLLSQAFTSFYVPYLALVIAAGTFIAGAWQLHRSAKVDYVTQLEKRIEECEKDRTALRREVKSLRDQTIDLMRRLVRLEEPAQ